MIVLAISSTQDVTDFASYIKRHPATQHYDFTLFSGIARCLSEDQDQKIVAIKNPQFLDKLKEKGEVVILRGHGQLERASLTIDLELPRDEVRSYMDNALKETPDMVTRINQVAILSCYSAEKVRVVSTEKEIASSVEEDKLAPSSLVTEVEQAFTEAHFPVEVVGCTGAVILHPNPVCPIVQINPKFIWQGYALQSILIESYREAIDESVAEMLAQADHEKDLDEKINLLQNTAKNVGQITEQFFNEFIKLAYSLGYLEQQGFKFNSIARKIEEINIGVQPNIPPQLEKLANLLPINRDQYLEALEAKEQLQNIVADIRYSDLQLPQPIIPSYSPSPQEVEKGKQSDERREMILKVFREAKSTTARELKLKKRKLEEKSEEELRGDTQEEEKITGQPPQKIQRTEEHISQFSPISSEHEKPPL